MNLYFAYGSNLNSDDLERWCLEREIVPVDLNFVETAWLPDHRIAFPFRSTSRAGGVLDIERCVGCAVPGAIFDPDTRGWEILDMKEGAPDWYSQRELVALTADGREVSVTTYAINPEHRDGHHRPGKAYLDAVTEALNGLGHPTRQLTDAAEGVATHLPDLIAIDQGSPSAGDQRRLLTRLGGEATPAATAAATATGDEQLSSSEIECYRFADPSAVVRELDALLDFAGYGNDAAATRLVIGGKTPMWCYR